MFWHGQVQSKLHSTSSFRVHRSSGSMAKIWAIGGASKVDRRPHRTEYDHVLRVLSEPWRRRLHISLCRRTTTDSSRVGLVLPLAC